MGSPLLMTADELLPLIEAGEIDHQELQEHQFAFAKQVDNRVRAFLSWDEEVETQSWDLRLGEFGMRRFHRLPYSVKDIFTVKGLPATAGSKLLRGHTAAYDASCVHHMRFEKNHLMGKTNLDEFAMGSSGELSGFEPTRNPWDEARAPGGSSSGSAAAVAACQSIVSLGTDTGGSVRQPAAFCGVVGFKPSYGQISRSGLIAYSSSCDQCGIIARSTKDIALVMNTISKPDEHDSTCIATGNVDFYQAAAEKTDWSARKIGVIKQFADPAAIHSGVLDNYHASLVAMEKAGAEIVELDFPLAEMCLPVYYIITAAECSSNLARYDGMRYGQGSDAAELNERYLEARSTGFGSEVKRRILLGTYVLSAGYFSAYYDKARKIRREIADTLNEYFNRIDVLATPTTPTPAFKLGTRLDNPVDMYMSDLCTVFVNLAGTGAISVPNGFTEDEGARLPTGIQFVGQRNRDADLLGFAAGFEELGGFSYKPPKWISESAEK